MYAERTRFSGRNAGRSASIGTTIEPSATETSADPKPSEASTVNARSTTSMKSASSSVTARTLADRARGVHRAARRYATMARDELRPRGAVPLGDVLDRHLRRLRPRRLATRDEAR